MVGDPSRQGEKSRGHRAGLGLPHKLPLAVCGTACLGAFADPGAPLSARTEGWGSRARLARMCLLLKPGL